MRIKIFKTRAAADKSYIETPKGSFTCNNTIHQPEFALLEDLHSNILLHLVRNFIPFR